MNTSFELTKQNIVDQIICEIKLLKKEEKSCSSESYYNKIYKMDLERLGNKKFIARQPSVTKEHRYKIKSLLREYLKLKIAENSVKDCNPERILDNQVQDEQEVYEVIEKYIVTKYFQDEKKIDSNSKQQIKEDVFRFKIKLDNCQATWFELSKEKFGRYSILSFESNKIREYRILSDDENILFQRGLLIRIFNGSQLENISFRIPEKKPDSFWSGWKTSMGAFNEVIAYLPFSFQHGIYTIGEFFSYTSPPWKEYEQIIHPALTEVSLELLKDCTETCPNIVEICGGEGDLAIKIAKNHPNQMNYYLLEYNDRSLYQAKKRILNEMQEDNKKIIPIKTDVTNSNDYFVDVEKQNPMNSNSIDFIIGSGALTGCVLDSKQTALEVAQKCYNLLKLGGKLILAGHAHSLLNSEDFIQLGFKIINSFLVGVQNETFATKVNQWKCSFGGFNKEFYILEK
jgi:hypothetical protein